MSNSSTKDPSPSPSEQLHNALQTAISSALSTRRPILTHLNADTTWLISLPCPEHSAGGRRYYHILIDPWLKGGQSDVAKFFSQQWHKEESSVQTIAEVEEVVQRIEDNARGESGHQEAEGGATMVDTELHEEAQRQIIRGAIDAVLVSHEFTDHMHKETLLEIPSSVPVFATSKAAGLIRSWSHFDLVFDISRFEGDWRNSSVHPLPSWIGVSRVAYPGLDLLYYHSAIMVSFSSSSAPSIEPTEAEAIIYTPHGISPENILPISTASPKVNTLALLHGLQDIQIKARFAMEAQLNKGAHNGLKVQRILKAKYWVGTHDEVKTGGGIVSWFLKREIISLGDAMEKEAEIEGKKGELSEVIFLELGNGESLILE